MRKFLIFLISLTLLISVLIFPASAVTDSVGYGTVNSTASEYLKNQLDDIKTSDHYIIYKSGDYSYNLVFGSDITYNGSDLVNFSNCDYWVYNTRSYTSGNSYTTSLTKTENMSGQINVSIYSIVYDDLGVGVDCRQSDSNTLNYILYTLLFALLIFIGFKFIVKRKSGVILK